MPLSPKLTRNVWLIFHFDLIEWRRQYLLVKERISKKIVFSTFFSYVGKAGDANSRYNESQCLRKSRWEFSQLVMHGMTGD